MIQLATPYRFRQVTEQEVNDCLRLFQLDAERTGKRPRWEPCPQEAARRYWAELAVEDRRELVRARRLAMAG